MLTRVGAYVSRYLCGFSAVILVVYTLKDAGTILLAGYTQRKTAAQGDDHVVFAPTHLVMCVELTKLLMSLVWCACDVSRQACAHAHGADVARRAREPSRHEGVGDTSHHGKAYTAVPVDDRGAMRTTKAPPLAGIAAALRWPSLRSVGRWLCAYAAEVAAHGNFVEVGLMAVPAVAYAVQNFLFIYALKMLSPSIFQLLYQLRIPLTALLMRVALHTRITQRKWLAILLLCAGVSATQLTTSSAPSSATPRPSAQQAHDEGLSRVATTASSTYAVGLFATLAACFVSSATSVFMEFVFKRRTVHCSLATRNVHLSFFSIAWLLLANLVEYCHGGGGGDAAHMASSWQEYRHNYLRGFTRLVWLLVVMQAAGGILVALVMKYADNILKSFCNAIAIVAVGIASVYIFSFRPSVYFVVGSALVLLAITLYNG